MSKNYFHAIKINNKLCDGCTKCIKICPTKALRVRNGKAEIDENKCIDCGKCVLECPRDAIETFADSISIIEKFKFKVAVLPASFSGQFNETVNYRRAKKAVLNLGFDEIADESMVTDIMSKFIRDYIRKHKNIRPIISSNCPAVVRLIQVRFTDLLKNILHLESPMSIIATYIREKISYEKNIDKSEIGVFPIVPCIAQVTAVHQPEGTYRHLHDGAISIRDIYKKVMDIFEDVEDYEDICSFPDGLKWAIAGLKAEYIADKDIDVLSVSGIDNVIDILAKIENGQIEKYDFVVMDSCTDGCIGGILNIENPFIAEARLKKIMRNSNHRNKFFNDKYFTELYEKKFYNVKQLQPRSIMKLDKDIKSAIQKMREIRKIRELLPGYDCAACGAPTCCDFAEDIVEGKANLEDCLILKGKKRG
jgi:iron only hydrogenase large subunit-like protein